MASVCKIPDEQNSEKQVGRLAAFSTFYQRAKIVLGIQFILTVPAAIVTSVIILLSPEAKVWTTFYSITMALMDALVLERIQSHFRTLAARTQELFDCELFELQWSSLRVGSKPDSEDIMEAASTYKKKHPSMSLLKDWYPKEVTALPLPLARLVCQRANCWWDANLRKKYANWLLAILIVTFVAVLAISLASQRTVEQMILTVYAPIAPAVLWSVREIRKQREAAESLEKIRTHVEKLWAQAMGERIPDKDLTVTAREIQDIIFDGRSKNPLIFDWINALVRPTQQFCMNAKAEELVNEALSSLRTKGGEIV